MTTPAEGTNFVRVGEHEPQETTLTTTDTPDRERMWDDDPTGMPETDDLNAVTRNRTPLTDDEPEEVAYFRRWAATADEYDPDYITRAEMRVILNHVDALRAENAQLLQILQQLRERCAGVERDAKRWRDVVGDIREVRDDMDGIVLVIDDEEKRGLAHCDFLNGIEEATDATR